MSVAHLDPVARMGAQAYAESFPLELPPSTREELEARIERLDAGTYALVHGALETIPYEAFCRAVAAVRGLA